MTVQQYATYPNQFEAPILPMGMPQGSQVDLQQLFTQLEWSTSLLLEDGPEDFDDIQRMCWQFSATGLLTVMPYNAETSEQRPYYGKEEWRSTTPPFLRTYRSHIMTDGFSEDMLRLITGDISGFANTPQILASAAGRRPTREIRALLEWAVANLPLALDRFGQRWLADAGNPNKANPKDQSATPLTWYNYAPATPLTVANVDAAVRNMMIRPNVHGLSMMLEPAELHVPRIKQWEQEQYFHIASLVPLAGPGGGDTGGNTNTYQAVKKLRVVPHRWLPDNHWFISPDLSKYKERDAPIIWLGGIGVKDDLKNPKNYLGVAPVGMGSMLQTAQLAGTENNFAGIQSIINQGVPQSWIETHGPGSALAQLQKKVAISQWTCMALYLQNSHIIEYRTS